MKQELQRLVVLRGAKGMMMEAFEEEKGWASLGDRWEDVKASAWEEL